MTPVKITGLDHAETFPVGATLVATSWHVAEHYQPGEPLPTERDAIAAGIAHIEELEKRHRAAYFVPDDGRPTPKGYLPIPERFSVDLRWKVQWKQGDLDANGRVSYSAGSEFTVRRQTYDTLTEAREHLARIDRFYPTGVGR